MSIIDKTLLRRALGAFATGITVITAQNNDGKKIGITANSFNSVSLDPPLILWSLDKRSTALSFIEESNYFCVNILSESQINLSNRFAKSGDDDFKNLNFTPSKTPILSDCAANFECKLWQVIDAGDHHILIGEVKKFIDNGHPGILFHQGNYALSYPYTTDKNDEDKQDIPTVDLLFATSKLYETLLSNNTTDDLTNHEINFILKIYLSNESVFIDKLREKSNIPIEIATDNINFLIEKDIIFQDKDKISLTSQGLEIAKKLKKELINTEKMFFQNLSEKETRQLTCLLKKLHHQ